MIVFKLLLKGLAQVVIPVAVKQKLEQRMLDLRRCHLPEQLAILPERRVIGFHKAADILGKVITTCNFAQILCMFLSVSAQYWPFYCQICLSRRFLAHILGAQLPVSALLTNFRKSFFAFIELLFQLRKIGVNSV